MSRTKAAGCTLSFLVLVVGASGVLAAEQKRSQNVLSKLGVEKGICVVLDDPRCELALGLAAGSELTVYVQVRKADDLQAACRAADAAGLYGTRIYVDKGDPARIHLADNLADALVAAGDPADIPRDEILRVLRPGGRALLGKQVFTKPFPEGTDDWTHHYHTPDNNPQSTDRSALAPYLTQFIVEPRYAPAPQNVVASGGRVFMALGNVAWHLRAEPWLDTLVAVNGFNGTMLWKRELTSGIIVDRSTMIATPTTLYLADEKSCKLLDPATGKLTGEITVGADLAGGTFWKWMALDGDALYALIGEQETPDAVKRWRRIPGHWPWNGISDGYNAKQYVWGFSKTLLAIDPKTRKVIWQHKEQEPIDSRSLCMKNGRIYFCHFGKYLVCLDAKTGKDIWRRTAEKDAELFKAMGPYRPGHGAATGWKSTIYLRCSDKALYFAGPQVFDVTAVSADDGRHLWTYHAERNPHVLIRDAAVYIIGASGLNGDTHKLDPISGKVLASYNISRRACTRATGSTDSIFFRGGVDGTKRIDLATGKFQWISPMRPSCFVGTLIAGGHLYWTPWACDCNLQMFGTICCAPAGNFKFDQAAVEAQRLESSSGAMQIAQFQQSPADWPTYRANNTRTAETQAAIPDRVGLLWTFTPKAALSLKTTSPVAVGSVGFLGGADGSVRALDAASGTARWTAYTGGAVRYPPAVADGRALVGSGDGYTYAFEAATGRLLWRFRAAPVERKINVYDRLLSTWPVASGVLLDGGVAYCAAGLNNYDGTHVYALDVATGKIKWQDNSAGGVGLSFGSESGVQGDLLLDKGKLYLASGSAGSPAVFDIADGKRLDPGQRARRGRELHLSVGKDKRGNLQRRVQATGQPFYSIPSCPVRSAEVAWRTSVVAAGNANLLCRPTPDGWKLVAQHRSNKKDLWQQPLPAEPVRWAVAVDAQGRIFVTLRNGQVVCFGKRTG